MSNPEQPLLFKHIKETLILSNYRIPLIKNIYNKNSYCIRVLRVLELILNQFIYLIRY